MPIFNYSCECCGHEDPDKLVKSHDTVVVCPFCLQPMTKNPSTISFVIEPTRE
jgi:predicted nucleic acid-binding Zn ribbon protein